MLSKGGVEQKNERLKNNPKGFCLKTDIRIECELSSCLIQAAVAASGI